MAESGSAVKRGRPKNLARRTEIALTAARLFAAEGYAGTSMRAVADAAGISESLLYHYFPRKNDIVLELVRFNQALLVRLGRKCASATRSAYTCKAFLKAVGCEYLDYVLQAQDLLVLWLMGVKEFHEHADALTALAGQIYQTFGKRLGNLPDYRSTADPVAALRFFMAGLYLTCVYRIRIGIPLPHAAGYEDLIEEAADFAARACSS